MWEEIIHETLLNYHEACKNLRQEASRPAIYHTAGERVAHKSHPVFVAGLNLSSCVCKFTMYQEVFVLHIDGALGSALKNCSVLQSTVLLHQSSYSLLILHAYFNQYS